MSVLGFGCEPLGGTDWGHVDEKLVQRAIRRALDLGIQYFDTAPVYGLGLSEERLSQFLGDDRKKVVIGTKAGLQMIPSAQGGRATARITSSRRAVFDSVRDSLRRLRIDTIPLLFIHYPDSDTSIPEVVDTLEILKKEGAVQGVGFSNFEVPMLEEISKLLRIDALQFEYNLLNRKCENQVLAFARQNQIPTYSYGVLARGILSGKFDREITFPSTDRRHRLEAFSGDRFRHNMALTNELRTFAVKYSTTCSAVAIRWLQQFSGISTTIVGIKSEDQLLENWEAQKIALSPEDLNEINKIFL